MIIWLEWWICSGKTTIWKELAKKLNWIFIEEHTPRIKNPEAFNLQFNSIWDFKKSFQYFMDTEIDRNKNINTEKIYIFDRTIYSLLWFAYAKWKIDNKNYLSSVKWEQQNTNLQKLDYIFVIQINNTTRLQRLNTDIIRKNNTPNLFYSEKFNKYNNEFLKNLAHTNIFFIDGNQKIENILSFILKTIWKNT